MVNEVQVTNQINAWKTCYRYLFSFFQDFLLDSCFTFKEKMVAICKQVFELGLQEHAKRQREVDEFYACVKEAKVENKDMGIVKIEQFNKYKKKVQWLNWI